MENVKQIQKAFRESRIAGEKMLSDGRISWEDFAFVMVGFELQLKSTGVNL